MIRLLESKPFLFFFRIICGRLWGSLAIEDHLRSILGIICGTVQNSVATTSLEFKHLYRKSRCEMLIGEMTLVRTSLPLTRLFQCLFTFALIGGNLTAQ